MINKLILVISLCLILLVVGCHSTPPTVLVTLYAGDSANNGVTRNQSTPPETIKCNDPRIDEGLWISYNDYVNLINTYKNGCALWHKDAKIYEEKLRSCGLLTPQNIETVRKCIGE